MALRPIKIDPRSIASIDSMQKIDWQCIECELVTPLHGGGVKARESDTAMPVRVASIRGQLRFWWRLLAQHKWQLPEKQIRDEEFKLWGGMSSGENGGVQASLVFLRVKMNSKELKEVPLSKYVKNINDTLGYALFTARRTQTGLPEMKLGKEGLKWALEWRFDEKRINEEQKKQVHETLRWWATLGGIGGRTRRGCGAFIANNINLVSEQEMREIGCVIMNKVNATSAIEAWKKATEAWKEIRKTHKIEFRELLGRNDEHSRHLATVFSRPVCDNQQQWHGMMIVLPNSTKQIKAILTEKKA